jgi:hypothetical protein
MPLERHWARQNTPFLPTARRELRVFVVASVVAALFTAIVVWAVLAGSTRSAGPGCHYKTIASTTGGANYKVCEPASSSARAR